MQIFSFHKTPRYIWPLFMRGRKFGFDMLRNVKTSYFPYIVTKALTHLSIMESTYS